MFTLSSALSDCAFSKIQNAENARRAHNADDEDEELMSHEEEDEADWPTRMTEQPSCRACTYLA